MKLILRQDTYENETLLSAFATEDEIKSALLTLDTTNSIELLEGNGSLIQTSLCEENQKYWVNLTEVLRRGKKIESSVEGQLTDLREVIRVFCYFLNMDPKLDSDFVWKVSTLDNYEPGEELTLVNAKLEDVYSKLDPEEVKEIRKRAAIQYDAMQSMSVEERKQYEITIINENQKFLAEQERLIEVSNIQNALIEAEIAKSMAVLDELIAQENSTMNETSAINPQSYNPSSMTLFSRGAISQKVICPHCNELGYIHVKSVSKKSGISGGKATVALLTAGLSLFVAGLSRSTKLSEAYCGNCESQWNF